MSQDPNVSPYGAAPSPPSAGAQGYEFGPNENRLIGALAGAMRFVAIFQAIAGVLLLVLAVVSLVRGHLGDVLGYGVESVLTLVLAGFLLGAAGRFRQVVETQGADIPILMAALEELRKFFNLQRILLIIALVLLAIAIVFAALLVPRVTQVSTPTPTVQVTAPAPQ